MYRSRRIHLIGIGGVGMAGIAEVLLTLGYQVSGTDLKESPVLARLRSLGGRIAVGHAAEHLGDAEVVVVSSAVPRVNPEWLAAEARGIPVVPRAEMLGELMRTKYAVAVSGAHGKTTTTSMIASVLTEGGLDPTVVVGGRIRAAQSGVRLGAGNTLVAEADESDGSFLKLWPTIAVVTNIDREHLDHFGSMEALRAAFAAFIDRVPFYGAAVLCLDNPEVRAVAAGATRRVLTYGLSPDAEYRAVDIVSSGLESRFNVLRAGHPLGPVGISMPGRHNVVNSLAAVAVGLEFELPFAAVRDGLRKFGGVARRFEIRGEHGEVIVVDDYGHHPTEIAAVLATARSTWPERRLLVVFQPHRYTRTRDLLTEFGVAFGAAGHVILAPIYAAGEMPIPGVGPAGLGAAIEQGSGVPVTVARDLAAAGEILSREVRPGDVVLTLGAGDVWRVGEAWLAGDGTAAAGAA
jgi:UDP-N-acetylmuramate--alanine ligase